MGAVFDRRMAARTYEWKSAASLYGTPAERVGPCRAGTLEAVEDWYSQISEFEQPQAGSPRDGIALAVDADKS